MYEQLTWVSHVFCWMFICTLINKGQQQFHPTINRHHDIQSKHLADCAVSTMIMKPLELPPHTHTLSQLLLQNTSSYNFTRPIQLLKRLSQPITSESITSVITLIRGQREPFVCSLTRWMPLSTASTNSFMFQGEAVGSFSFVYAPLHQSSHSYVIFDCSFQ